MDYRIIRSNRRTLGLEVTAQGELVVRAPRLMPKWRIQAFVDAHKPWIEQQMAKVKRAAEATPLTEAEIKDLTARAKVVFAERAAFYATKIGVTYGRITIRHQKTRWGSCSREGNLNFNCLLLLAPPQVLDSVVVHELCHRKEMNHSRRFYAEVLKVFPEYHIWHQWLKDHGQALLHRLPEKGT
ncbi:MAG: DUF45 domain-containing protein [Firmicutes bacterium]|nr:DUF45 domain-containing protein [Bacillota bacterium]